MISRPLGLPSGALAEQLHIRLHTLVAAAGGAA